MDGHDRVDQMAQGQELLASATHQYKVRLLMAGFTPEEAFELVRDYHQTLLDEARDSDE